MLEIRKVAIETGNFSEMDALKSALTDAGIEVRMSKESIELIPGTNFELAKLEALK